MSVNGGSRHAQTSPACVARWPDLYTMSMPDITAPALCHVLTPVLWTEAIATTGAKPVSLLVGGTWTPTRWLALGPFHEIPQSHPRCMWFLICQHNAAWSLQRKEYLQQKTISSRNYSKNYWECFYSCYDCI